MSTHIEPLLTNADLEGLPEDGNRYELIAGELYVSTAPDLIHQRTAGRIYLAFANYLEQHQIAPLRECRLLNRMRRTLSFILRQMNRLPR